MAQGCWSVLSALLLQTVLTGRGPDGGLRVAPGHGSLSGGNRAYGSGAGRPGTAKWNRATCSGYRSRRASGCGTDQAAAASRRSTDVSALGRRLQQLREQGPAQWLAQQQGGAPRWRRFNCPSEISRQSSSCSRTISYHTPPSALYMHMPSRHSTST